MITWNPKVKDVLLKVDFSAKPILDIRHTPYYNWTVPITILIQNGGIEYAV